MISTKRRECDVVRRCKICGCVIADLDDICAICDACMGIERVIPDKGE